ncbi:UDP-4-amino-4,6-dideoxy-N-acetyl-beta-L-altrosamine N-acetyltransferase [Flavobacterium sp.]|uniref:UDP-4-amino-4, 6-dideoxy-N-acetyl-beta-L-altrosamine N-acetyltransferase n=1 Tax=Flavobacterium sp. TaxID=239 RepID=UPI00391DC563
MSDISLRVLTAADIELVRNWRNSPDVAPYMYNETPISAEQQIKWFEKISNDSTCVYWIIEYDGKKLGLASVTGIDRTLSSCYWAFYLGDLSVRGGGIGAKIEYNVLEYVFNELKLNKLRCEVFVTNDKVIKMHEKFGFRREAYYREHCIKNGQKLDVVGLAILQSEWNLISDFMKNKIYGQ